MQIIRPETTEYAAVIRRINEEAFGQPQEAEIVEKLCRYYFFFLFDQENLMRLPLCFLFFLFMVSTKV